MTKKDYELFANEIFNSSEASRQVIVNTCIRVFSKDNPLFNPDKFERACYEGKHIRKSIKS